MSPTTFPKGLPVHSLEEQCRVPPRHWFGVGVLEQKTVGKESAFEEPAFRDVDTIQNGGSYTSCQMLRRDEGEGY